MRIAFFTDTYLPNVDGVVTSILTTRQELERRGHEVYIFSPGTKKQKEESKDPRTYYFSSASFKPYPDYRLALFNFISPLKLIKDLNIDIIHSHGLATTSLAAIRSSQKFKIPSVATFHTLISEAIDYLTTQEQLKSTLQNIAWQYLRWHYSNYPKVLVPSEWVQRIFDVHGIKNTTVLPSGVDLSRFNNVDARHAKEKFGFGKSPVILHVGRIAKEKRLELLIESASSVLNLLPEAKFVIAGKGPAETYYNDLIAKQSLRSHFLFTGYVDERTLQSLYAAADVLAFPSLFDTQGLVVLEALACGTPAVVQKQSAPADFIKDNINGQLFNDHFDLPEKIVAAIKHKKKMKKAAIETANRYDIKKITDQLLEIYQSSGAKID